MIKGVVKSHIILLVFANKKRRSEIINQNYHDKIDTKDFVHKCYIESARAIYNHPDLFWHESHTIEQKRNQREACDLIKLAIREAIRKMLPIKLILKEYLENNYFDDDDTNIPDSKYMTVQSMVKRDLYGLPEEVIEKGALETSSSSSVRDHQSDSATSSKDHKDDTKSEDLMRSSDTASSANSVDEDAFLGEMENKLKAVEQEMNKVDEIPTNIPVQPVSVMQQPIPTSPPIVNNPIPISQIPQAGGVPIPRAMSDDEIKELLKKADMVTTLDNPKKKLNKKELMLMKEIEGQIKPKGEEPDRKLFFEQYMK